MNKTIKEIVSIENYKIPTNNAKGVVENLEKQGDTFDKDFLTMTPKND